MKTIVGLALSALIIASTNLVWAEHRHQLEEPLQVISGMVLRNNELRPGMDFHASLPQTVQFKDTSLEEGTQFIGHVDNIRHCTNATRLCRFDIWIDQVILPNEKVYQVYPNDQIKPQFTFKPRFWSQQPQTLLEAGSTLNLQFAPSIMKGILMAGNQKSLTN